MDSSTLFTIILLTITAVADIILGLAVLLRNTKKRLNRRFFWLAVTGTLWVLSNLLFFSAPENLLYTAALISYGAAALLAVSFWLFCIDMASLVLRRRYQYAWLGFGLATAVVSCVPGILATDVTDDLSIVTNSLPLALYGLWVGVNFITGIVALVVGYRKAIGKERSMLLIVLMGLSLAAMFGLFFNLALPLLDNYKYVGLGPVSVLLFVASASYAIVKHKLFDIRSVAARTVAYVFSILLVVIIYAALIFATARLIYPENTTSMGQSIVNIMLAVVVALAFQPLKKLFDSLTDKIFFRNSYSPQLVLDKTSDIIAVQVTPRQLIGSISKLLEAEMRVESADIFLKEKASLLLDLTERYFQTRKTSILVVDDLYASDDELFRELNEKKFGVIVRLRTAKSDVGFLCLGVKRDGGTYIGRDIETLKVVGGELAVALQNALRYEEIRAFNETLQNKVDEATSELKVTNKRLQQLDKSKDEFISMASHQLRTPLTSVKGYISMVLEGDMGKISTQQRQVLEQAYDSSQRMVFLISDFLNVSRIQTGKFELEPSTINFTDLVAEEVDQLNETAKMRKMTLVYDKPETDHQAVGDENKLRQVMMNFIDNAIFYSPAGSSIAIHLYKEASGLVFKVVDQGIGVPKEAQSKLFTKFFRASNARQQRPDGTGIGLYMAKKVIIAHGGSIIFETKEGVGSTFGFQLPLENDLKNHRDKPNTSTDNSSRNSS